jgi:hypothetical protein
MNRWYGINQTSAVWILETSRIAAAAANQPLYVGEYTVTVNNSANTRTTEFAEAVIEWVLELHGKASYLPSAFRHNS